MDRSWMHKSRLPKDYELGVENFISFGFSNTKDASIRCPCLKCGNCEKQSRTTIRDHLYVNGIDERYGWSDISFSELLKTLKEILPTFNEISTSIYEAKKTLGALGMSYEKIHACPNDCCLYRKEHANATECPECGESRWKYANNANEGKK
ncbi:hypothetical protein IC575_014988 [Cucumis melo]